MTEYQKMQNGMLYDCLDEEIGREIKIGKNFFANTYFTFVAGGRVEIAQTKEKSIMKSREAR